jgi:uncharacterized protein (DUF1330 family)
VGAKHDRAPKFLPPVLKAIADHGGKYVAGGFNKTTTLHGASPPNRVVIVEFESMAKAKAWWDSEDQKAATKIGEIRHPEHLQGRRGDAEIT